MQKDEESKEKVETLSRKARKNRVNELMELISTLSREFYLNKETGNVCYFNTVKNSIIYIDSYLNKSGKMKVGMTAGDLMEWCNGGNTLRTQILEFAHFIRTGEHILILSRYWGISLEEQFKLHQKAYDLGIIKHSKEYTFKDYSQNKDVSFKLKERSER